MRLQKAEMEMNIPDDCPFYQKGEAEFPVPDEYYLRYVRCLWTKKW